MTVPQDPQQPEFTQPTQPTQPVQPSQPPQYAPPTESPQYASQYAQPTQPHYAQQPPPQQHTSYPGQYGAPQPPKRGLSAGAIIGIVAGAFVLLLLLVFGGIVAVGAVLAGAVASSSSSWSSDYDNEDPALGSPGDIVEEYLNALADGDADAARDIVGETSSNKLLSNEVLKKSLEFAPMTNISVDDDSIQQDSYGATVSASFDLGGKTITRDFSVYDNYEGEWELEDGLADVSLSAFKGLGVSLNGVPVKDDYVQLFPGTYEVDMSVEAFTLEGGTNTVALTHDTAYSHSERLTPVLTENANKLFTELVSASLKECLALKTLTTPCGNNVDAKLSDGSTVADGDIRRTLTTEGEKDLKGLKTRSDFESPSSVSAFALVDIEVSLTNGDANQSRRVYGGPLLTPTVDFAAEKPTVTWKK